MVLRTMRRGEQMHRVNPDDTREFPLKPEPMVSRSIRDGMRISAKPFPSREIVPDFDEEPADTREAVLLGKRPLSQDERRAEMGRIRFVVGAMEGKVREFLPPCNAGASERLENALMDAATMAYSVGMGRSPRQEFFSRVPSALMAAAMGIYGRRGEQ